MRASLAFLLLALLYSEGQAQLQDKRGYNLWAKEKIRYLNAKVTINPYNPQLRVLLANAYFDDGQKYEAKRLLLEALQLDPDYAEAHCNLAVMLHGQGYDREAQAPLRRSPAAGFADGRSHGRAGDLALPH